MKRIYKPRPSILERNQRQNEIIERLKVNREQLYQQFREAQTVERCNFILEQAQKAVDQPIDFDLLRMLYDEIFDFKINLEQSSGTSQPGVVCPVCETNSLKKQLSVFYCSCGARLDVENDPIELELFQRRIEDTLLEHGMNCRVRGKFFIKSVDVFGVELVSSSLWFECSGCHCQELVI